MFLIKKGEMLAILKELLEKQEDTKLRDFEKELYEIWDYSYTEGYEEGYKEGALSESEFF